MAAVLCCLCISKPSVFQTIAAAIATSAAAKIAPATVTQTGSGKAKHIAVIQDGIVTFPAANTKPASVDPARKVQRAPLKRTE